MEQLLGQDFDGILEYIAQDADGNIAIRMQCTSKTQLYFDENDDDYERKETEPMNKKVFIVIYQGHLEWGEPLLCKPEDKISIRQWYTTEKRENGDPYETAHYGLTNETLDADDGGYVWLNNL